MAILLQAVSRKLFKTQSHKNADMSKVNSKFPNCFQPVQLFFGMSTTCLPSFVSKGLKRGEGESRVGNDFKPTINICVLNTVANLVLCIEYCDQFSEKPPCCQIKSAFWTKMATAFKMSSSLNKTYLTKTISKIL